MLAALRSAGVVITVYTIPGSALHSILCEAFMEWGGYVLIEMDHLYTVETMEPAADGERVLWRLAGAAHAGAG